MSANIERTMWSLVFTVVWAVPVLFFTQFDPFMTGPILGVWGCAFIGSIYCALRALIDIGILGAGWLIRRSERKDSTTSRGAWLS